MRVVILAAGEGKRLRPYTENVPKCMVKLHGKPMLHYQLDAMDGLGIKNKNIALVGGYLQEELCAANIKQYRNEDYAKTNMVETLFSAEEFFPQGEDLVISYGDIVYNPRILKALIDHDGDIVVTADLDWQKLWRVRMDEPLDDAETFIVERGLVKSLGKTPRSYDDVEAQYMGLVKISADKINDFKAFYYQMRRDMAYDSNSFKNMYMTTFLQELINYGWRVMPCYVRGGWVEVDTSHELEIYENIDLDALIK